MSGGEPTKIESQNKSYKIIKRLGEGGTSVVYLANDGKRDVALKILGEEADPAFKDKYVEILKNEFEVLSKLRHPNVAEVYDFEFSKDLGKYFFTTEYVNGTDIYNYTSSADLKGREDLFVQLLLALDYVHRCGVIHCDIKCGNALVAKVKNTPVVKLVDFGFATRRLATSGNVVGTIHYLAPELLVRERSGVDHRVDIYAAGIVLYRLLHRSYPYESSNVADILAWHREGLEPPFAENIPEYLKQLILRMIATYPTDRIASCAKAIEFINLRTEGRYKKVVERIAGLQFKEGPLVGRNEPLKTVQSLLQEIKSGKSPSANGLICIGPQGIGKSRLFKEIRYRTELEEIALGEFSCIEGHDHVEGFASVFKDVERKAGDEKSEDRKRLADVDWINRLFDKYREKGLLILIDDIQLANSAFIKFLALLEDRLKVNKTERVMPIAILVGSRPKDELNDIVGRWFEKTSLPKTELTVFTRPEVEEYIGKLGPDNPARHIEPVLAFSGGIPGLVEAYFQHVLSPAGDAKPPDSLAQSYIERAKQVSKRARTCLEFISVARRNLETKDLAGLTQFGSEEVADCVKELVVIGFVKIEYPSMSVSLTNKAIGQTMKGAIDAARLKEISAALGKWLVVKEPANCAEIAEYFSDAGLTAEALRYAEAAAQRFEERFNNSEAARFYRMALVNVTDEIKKKTLSRSVARMGILTGRYKDAISSVEGLLKSGDETLENYRLLGMAYTKMHDFEHARQWYEAGLKKMTDETAITDIVQFKNSIGNVYFYTGNIDQSEKYFTEAIADATECLLLNNNLGMVLGAKGNYEHATQFYDGRKRFLAAKQNKRALSLCYAECGYIHMTNNHLQEAIRDLEESYRLAADMGDWYNILVVIGNLVRCYQQTAQYSKAIEYALKGLEAEGNVGSIEEIAQNHLTIGILYETMGIFDLAAQHIGMARDRFIAVGDKKMIGWCHLSMSYVFKDLDKFNDAVAELDSAKKVVGEGKAADLDTWELYTRADLLCEYGKTAEAAKLLANIKPSQSLEFNLRQELLHLKIEDDQSATNEFNKIIERCGDFPELAWEVYASFGAYLEKRGKNEKAFEAYRKAYEIIESIAGGLTEAYRDSYRAQRFRLKIVQKFKPEFAKKSSRPGKQGDSKSEANTSEIK